MEIDNSISLINGCIANMQNNQEEEFEEYEEVENLIMS